MAKNNFKAKTASASDPNYVNTVGSAAAPGIATGMAQEAAGTAGLGTTLGQQQSFAQMLQQQAAGKGGPTLADQAVKDVTARNDANAAGFAAGAKGLSPALAARQALMAQAGNNQGAAGQAAQTHIQEQQQAQAEEGGALAGAAGTAGGLASAGTGLTGTTGGLTNTSNANLNTGQDAANSINADVAKQNASAINSGIGSIVNAAGGVLGMSEGGEVPGRYPKAMAAGGVAVPHESVHMAHVKPPAPGPRRSFAAQVAHHLTREYFDDGGTAGVHQEVPASEADKRQTDLENASASTSDLETSSLAAAPKGEKNVQGVDLSEKGKAKPMRANVKKYSEGGDVDDDEPDTDEGVDGSEPDMGDNEEYMAKGGSAGGGLFNLSSKIHGLLHPVTADAIVGPLTQTQGAPLPAGYMPPGTVHKELADAPAPAAPEPEAHADAEGNLPEGTTSFKSGGPVPGKAKVKGNSLENDTVDAKLSPGEVVLPRTISHDPKKAASFVDHLQRNGGDGAKTLKDIKGKRKS